MSRVKEVVKWIINKKIYCILNMYHDSDDGSWLYDKLNGRNKYFHLWKQIAEEFKDFNEYLMFESMHEPKFFNGYSIFDYTLYNNFTQGFVDILRSSGGFNTQRLLIISGISNFRLFSIRFQIPNDPSRNLAISFVYYEPKYFTLGGNYNYFTWGGENNYKDIIKEFQLFSQKLVYKLNQKEINYP